MKTFLIIFSNTYYEISKAEYIGDVFWQSSSTPIMIIELTNEMIDEINKLKEE